MKVAFLTTSFPRFKGDYSGVFILELAKSLIDKGVSVKVICPNDDMSKERELVDGVEVIRFNYFIKRMQKLAYGGGGILENLRKDRSLYFILPLFLLSYIRCVINHIEDSDIIHAHWYPSGVIALISRCFHSIPCVLTVHGSDIHIIKNRYLKQINRLILKRIDRIITVSEFLKDDVISLGLNSNRVVFIPNGVSVGNRIDCTFSDSKKSERNTVLFAGSLRKIKAVDTLIKAFQIVLKQRADANLVIIGEGPESGRLKALCETLGIKEHVHFTGAIPPYEVRRWMRQGALLVLPSLLEGRPIVILEAMAEGLPVIGSDIAALKEIIEDGKTGFLFKTLCHEELSDRILRLLNDPDLRLSMGINGRKKLMELGLTWDNCARMHMDLYRSIKGSASMQH